MEISLREIEYGNGGSTQFRLDLKFYSPSLKRIYAQLSKGKYACKLVRKVADPVKSGVKVEPNNEYKYIQISDIDGNMGEIIDATTLMGMSLPSRAQRTLSRNDLLISAVRPLLREIAVVPDDLDGQIGTSGFIQLRCKEGEMEPEYLFHILRCKQVTCELDRRSSALNYPAISKNDVLDLEIPCPPRNVRLKLIEEFAKETEKVKTIRDRIKKLQVTRSKVLSSYLKSRKSAPVPKNVGFSIDEAQSNGCRMDVKFYRYSRQHPYEHLPLIDISPGLFQFSPEEINLNLTPEDEFVQVTVSRKKGVVFREQNQGKDIGTKKQTRIRAGEVVVSRIDLYNGCAGIVPKDLDGAIITRDFMALRLDNNKVDPTYFVEVLKDGEMADYFYAFAVGATGRKRIDQDVFGGLKVPVIDPTVQKHIRDKLLKKDNEIRRLQTEMASIYQNAENRFIDALGIPNS